MANLLDYIQLLKDGGEARFRATVPCPALVESAYTDDPARLDEAAFRTSFLGADQAASAVLPPKEREVLLVQKREGAAFSGHIGVGRTPNLDVRIARAGISKFHAYFSAQEDGVYQLTDKASTNGTFVDGVRLAPGEPVTLEGGVEVKFAAYSFTYLPPDNFLQMLQSLARH